MDLPSADRACCSHLDALILHEVLLDAVQAPHGDEGPGRHVAGERLLAQRPPQDRAAQCASPPSGSPWPRIIDAGALAIRFHAAMCPRGHGLLRVVAERRRSPRA